MTRSFSAPSPSIPAAAARSRKRKKSSFLQVLGVPEMFLISLKLSFYAAIVLSFPILLYYIADFVLPGLTPKEKKAVLPAVAIGFALFLIGVTFSYYVVLPRALNFFYHYADDRGIENAWRIGYYIKFATGFVFVFGLCFELPVVVMISSVGGSLPFQNMCVWPRVRAAKSPAPMG